MFSVSTFLGFNPKVFHHDSHFDSNKASLCLSIQSLKETYSLKSSFLSPVCVATTFQPLKTASPSVSRLVTLVKLCLPLLSKVRTAALNFQKTLLVCRVPSRTGRDEGET